MNHHDLRVSKLRTQYQAGLLGVPRDGLRFSWNVSGGLQLGYQLAYSNDSGTTEGAAVSNTSSIGQRSDLPDATYGEVRRYAVRVRSDAGWSEWSTPIEVEAAGDVTQLAATAIGFPTPVGGPSPLLRRTFQLDAAPARARLSVTSLGINEMRINGAVVGEDLLAPGWTAYRRRLVVSTFDVTELLHAGENVIGGILSDGWYRGRVGWSGRDSLYGTDLALMARLDVETADGATLSVTTDERWRGSTGAILESSLYDGSVIDQGSDQPGWDRAGFDDADWRPVVEVPVSSTLLEPRTTLGVRKVAELPMSSTVRAGTTALDAGQNVSGWVKLTVRGAKGARVVVRHAEVLDSAGTLHTAPLRSARATDEYVLASTGVHELEPVFTFHGFQYAEVVGAEVLDARAVAISSATDARAFVPLVERRAQPSS